MVDAHRPVKNGFYENALKQILHFVQNDNPTFNYSLYIINYSLKSVLSGIPPSDCFELLLRASATVGTGLCRPLARTATIGHRRRMCPAISMRVIFASLRAV